LNSLGPSAGCCGRRFDALLGEHSVYKVETIGDCYMVAGGLVFTDAQGYTSVMQSKVRQGPA
jgi:hypothetical protein